GAQEVFQGDDKVAVFIFGHTHSAFLRRLGPAGQVVINTGTWLKLLSRVPVRFGLLPAIYYPSYRLNYFRIEKGKRPSCDRLCRNSQDASARTDLAAASRDPGECA